MSAITFYDSFLSQNSDASQMDNDFRDFSRDVALGLSTNMRWPGSGGGSVASAGEMTPGSMRIGSAMTNPSPSALTRIIQGGWDNGTIMWHQRDQDHVSAGGFAMHSGSDDTFVFGGAKLEVQGAAPVTAVPYTARWLVETGEEDLVITSSAATKVFVSFPVQYRDVPFVMTAASNAWQLNAIGVGAIVGISDVTIGGFISTVSVKGAIADPYTTKFQWMAEGVADY